MPVGRNVKELLRVSRGPGVTITRRSIVGAVKNAGSFAEIAMLCGARLGTRDHRRRQRRQR